MQCSSTAFQCSNCLCITMAATERPLVGVGVLVFKEGTTQCLVGQR